MPLDAILDEYGGQRGAVIPDPPARAGMRNGYLPRRRWQPGLPADRNPAEPALDVSGDILCAVSGWSGAAST